MSRVVTCCNGMDTMIADDVIRISGMSNKIWMKVLIHNGTNELDPYRGFRDYNEITHCPFCGQLIQVT
jgi:hypothetical protein